MTSLMLGLLAAAGVHLLTTRGAPIRTRRHPRRRPQPESLAAFVGGVGAGLVLVGGAAAVGVGLVAAACTAVGRRTLTDARHDQARRRWPAVLDEVRVLVTSGGRSLPRALLQAGQAVPEPFRDAFRAGAAAWSASADTGLLLRALRDRAGDATTDLVTDTLAVVDGATGPDLGRRLQRLAEDRRRDLEARDLATARLAGARFARRFVLLVPLGMAVAGQAVGTGRAAFATPAGQLVGLVAASMVGGCWLWAGHLLALPPERRSVA